jgi:hypothetical protein
MYDNSAPISLWFVSASASFFTSNLVDLRVSLHGLRSREIPKNFQENTGGTGAQLYVAFRGGVVG